VAGRKPVTIGLHGAPWQGASINFSLICAVGAGVGFLAGILMGTTGKIMRIEEMLVGVFGAFIGGDFLVSQINGPTATGSLVQSLGMALGGAAVMLVLLRMMRGVVGPLASKKSRVRPR
jgi:uncharacterized membrane protein YeaQ/YmgE (transglycosylase-associated protein family)